ncbi:MAG: hypothetical protein V8Q57_08205 [Blautia sp.]
MGFNPEVTKDKVRECISNFSKKDTHITRLSRAFDIEVGTGWYVPAGVIGKEYLLTYEPQWGTDEYCMENVVCGEVFGRSI